MTGLGTIINCAAIIAGGLAGHYTQSGQLTAIHETTQKSPPPGGLIHFPEKY